MARSDLAILVRASTEQLKADLDRGAGYVRQWGRDVDRSSPKGLFSGMGAGAWKGMAAATHGMSSAFKSAAVSMASFAKQTAATAAGIAVFKVGAATLSGIMGQLKDSVRLAAELEQTHLAFEVMLGSAGDALQLVGDLRKFAAETPFGSGEIISAARQLMAYGTAAGEIVPQLRVLGDITAGLGGNTGLGDMAYLFGTLQTQGRAFSKDIYQFTNRGVDLLGPMSQQLGRSKGELMDWVEQGRIGIGEVGRALEALRGPGGRFENMMQRQSKTMAGLWEMAKDGFEIAKAEFGQIVIDEMGLKDAARDVESFTRRIKSSMQELRPFIRFIGDVGKAAVQLGYEFGRSAVTFGNVFVRQLEAVIPNFKERINDIQQMVKDAGTNKFDPVRVTEISADIGEWIINTGIWLVDSIYTAGVAFNENFIKPMIKAANAISDLIGGVDDALGSVWTPWSTKQTNWINKQRFGIEMPIGGMADEDVIRNWKALRQEILIREAWKRDGTWLEKRQAHFELGELQSMQSQFLKRYSFDNNAYEHLKMGLVPSRELMRAAGNEPVVNTIEKLIAELKENRKALREQKPRLRQEAEDRERLKWEAERDAEGAAEFKAQWDRSFNVKMLRANAAELSKAGEIPLLGGGPFGGLGGLMGDARQLLRADQADSLLFPLRLHPVTEPVASMFGGRPERGLRFDNRTPDHIRELANRIKDDMDPLRELGRDRAQRAKAVEFGALTQGQADWADRRQIQDIAERLGIGQQVQLPDAIEKDSVEAVRLLNQWRAGNQQQSTESLLKQIAMILEQINAKATKQTEVLHSWIPIPIPLPR